jgi:hypothetical protein
VGNGTAPITAIATGSPGQVLTLNPSSVPIWQASPAGFTNPMTTPGDIIYGGAAGAANRLATGTGFLKGGVTPSYSAIDLAADVTGTLPGSSVNPSFTSNISTTGTLSVAGTTTFNTRTYTWPSTALAASTFLQTDAAGNLSWVPAAAAFTNLNIIPKGSAGGLVISSITDTGTQVAITSASPALELSSTGNSSTLSFRNASGTIATISDPGSSEHLQIATTALSQGILFNTNSTPRMAIDNSGNVGIGTTTPAYPLDIQTPSGLSAYGLNHSDGTITMSTYVGNGGVTGGSIGTQSDHPFFIYTANGGARMTVLGVNGGTNSGGIGIGTTAPVSRLHVVGNDLGVGPANTGTIAKGTVRLTESSSVPALDMGIADDTYVGGWLQAHQATDQSINFPLLLNPNGGNVGIGVTTPDADATLHVLGFASRIRAEGFGASLSLVANPFFSGSTHDFLFTATSGGNLLITDNGANRMQITSTGGVNINGTLSKGAGTFKIDHPQDPENKFLYHSFVESPDMMNVYNGNITTDENGNAIVALPDYFENLNKDFRYQLTVLGEFAQAIVAKKVKNNQFVIKTDKPKIEVSWQVTGIRKDPFAEKNRVAPEVLKSPEEKGKYLHPEAYGLPPEKGIDNKPNP